MLHFLAKRFRILEHQRKSTTRLFLAARVTTVRAGPVGMLLFVGARGTRCCLIACLPENLFVLKNVCKKRSAAAKNCFVLFAAGWKHTSAVADLLEVGDVGERRSTLERLHGHDRIGSGNFLSVCVRWLGWVCLVFQLLQLDLVGTWFGSWNFRLLVGRRRLVGVYSRLNFACLATALVG